MATFGSGVRIAAHHDPRRACSAAGAGTPRASSVGRRTGTGPWRLTGAGTPASAWPACPQASARQARANPEAAAHGGSGAIRSRACWQNHGPLRTLSQVSGGVETSLLRRSAAAEYDPRCSSGAVVRFATSWNSPPGPRRRSHWRGIPPGGLVNVPGRRLEVSSARHPPTRRRGSVPMRSGNQRACPGALTKHRYTWSKSCLGLKTTKPGPAPGGGGSRPGVDSTHRSGVSAWWTPLAVMTFTRRTPRLQGLCFPCEFAPWSPIGLRLLLAFPRDGAQPRCSPGRPARERKRRTPRGRHGWTH